MRDLGTKAEAIITAAVVGITTIIIITTTTTTITKGGTKLFKVIEIRDDTTIEAPIEVT